MFRHLFWFLAWATVAVALALLVGQNHASVTVFWPPYRVDLSFNLVLFGLIALFLLLHLSWRGASSLAAMPGRARHWRARQLERSAVSGVMDALSHQLAGRFVRAQAAGLTALERLNAIDPRQRFTLAHELGHYLVHRHLQTSFNCSEVDTTQWDSDERKIESEANA